MRRSWERPGLSRHAILALIATLLLAFQGVAAAARAPASEAHSAAVDAMADHAGARVCAIAGRSGDAPAAPHDTHCPDDCCMLTSGPSAVAVLQAVALVLGAVRCDEAHTLSHRLRAPARTSGWASSWSSRAPPRRG